MSLPDRHPYVGGETVDGCLRSAQIDLEERDTLATDRLEDRESCRISSVLWEHQADRWAISEVDVDLAHFLRREPWVTAARELVATPRNVLVAEMGAGGREVLLAAAARIARERGADGVEVIDRAVLRHQWAERWKPAGLDVAFHTPEGLVRGTTRLDPDNRVVILPLLEQWRPRTKIAQLLGPVLVEAPWVLGYLHCQLVRPGAMPSLLAIQPDPSRWARLDRPQLDKAYGDIPTAAHR